MKDTLTGTSLGHVLDEWKKDAVVDRLQPQDAIAKIGELHEKYLRFLAQANKNAKLALTDYKRMLGIRSAYYKGELAQETLDKYTWDQYLGSRPTKTGLDRLLETDEALLKILGDKSEYDEISEQCEKIVSQINFARTKQISEYMTWERSMRPNG